MPHLSHRLLLESPKSLPHCYVPTRDRYHSRDADLEEIVLDQLLAQHDDAQLDAELHQAAPRGTLRDRRTDGKLGLVWLWVGKAGPQLVG